MSGEGKVVCVTGGSGYIASWLVKLLLQHGYTVKATVRNPNDPKKTEHLLALDGAKERLHLFKADLLEEGSFDSAIDGCDGVFHTASPSMLSAPDPQAEIIEPAVKGTLNVLRSCAKVPSIKRVVITSSMASLMLTGKPLTPDVVVDETWFSDPVICEKLEGLNRFGSTVFGFVDVRDVAAAHIQAFEVASASGRYCLAGNVARISETSKILRELYPDMCFPEKREDDKPLQPKYRVSSEKAKSLGISFIPLEVSLRDTVESLKEKGLLPSKTCH